MTLELFKVAIISARVLSWSSQSGQSPLAKLGVEVEDAMLEPDNPVNGSDRGRIGPIPLLSSESDATRGRWEWEECE